MTMPDIPKSIEERILQGLQDHFNNVVREEAELASQRVKDKIANTAGSLVEGIMRKIKIDTNRDPSGGLEIRIKYPELRNSIENPPHQARPWGDKGVQKLPPTHPDSPDFNTNERERQRESSRPEVTAGVL